MSNSFAFKFEESANSYATRIDGLRNSGTSQQRITPRRQRIYEQQLQDAVRLEEVQKALAALAAAWGADVVPGELRKIKDAFTVETIIRCQTMPSINGFNQRGAKALHRAGIQSDAELEQARSALMLLIPPGDESTALQASIRRLERELVMQNIPDFFPTPPAVIEQMLIRAAIETHHTVLEPQIGSARIADEIRRHYPNTRIEACEINPRLADLAEMKGYQVHRGDFLQFQGGPYDRIVMNPPFSGMAEIDHIQHAFRLLNPAGGRLVSLASQSPFHQSTKRAVNFRAWAEGKDAIIKNLPSDAFKTAERPTGTTTCIVTITRWEA